MEQNISFPLPPAVTRAISLLSDAGYEAYAVGGAVRDLLRGVTPHDYDITTSATPDEMKGVFSAFRTVETGIKHGTLTVLFDGEPLEITTFRVDGEYTDSRHPDSVIFTRSLREDAARRDFTVNAMAYHPTLGLFDFFGGREDLAQGVLRTVGDPTQRFTEDALRILRALRFAASLGYRIEESTSAAVHALAHTLSRVAPERIREELVKLIVSEHAVEVLREYHDVFCVFLPEIAPLVGFDQKNPHHDYDIWEHTLHALAATPPVLHLRLAILLHDMGKPASFSLDSDGVGHFYGHAGISTAIAEDVMRRLRFDNETRERVCCLVGMHDIQPAPDTKQYRRIRSREGDEMLLDWLTVIRADRTGQKASLPPDVAMATKKAEEAAHRLLSSEERITLASLALRGEDLIACGYRGRAIGEALAFALSGVIEKRTENEKNALLAYIRAKEEASHVECERKFLIARPSDATLRELGAEGSEITQTYLLSTKERTARVRRRIYADKTEYTHTEKKRLSARSATEEEREITKDEYDSFCEKRDPSCRVIQKTRYTLPFAGHVLEIDVYPFWTRQAVLEIELASEAEHFALPKEIRLLREVTEEGAYKNAALAKRIPDEDNA